MEILDGGSIKFAFLQKCCPSYKSWWRVWIVLGVLLILTSPYPLHAQTPDPPTVIFHWERYTQDGGLLSNDVHALLAVNDSIWVGTDRGLARYDGIWTQWLANPNTLIDGMVLALAKASDGGVWIGTVTGTLARWQGAPHTRGELTRIAQASAAILAIHESQGQLWVGTEEGLFRWDQSEWIPIEPITGSPVYTIVRQNSLVWVGTEDGLWVLQRDRWTRFGVEDGLPSNTIYAIWIDADGHVWIGTESGLGVRDPRVGTWQIIPTEGLSGAPYRILSLAGSSRGLWGGTDGDGAFRVNAEGTVLPVGGDVGLTNSVIRSVVVDDAGSLWLGTATGILRNDIDMWIAHSWGAELQINTISSLVEDSRGSLWMGTDGFGIRVSVAADVRTGAIDPLAPETLRYTQAEGLPSEVIFALTEDAAGNIWAATDNGVARFERLTGRWQQPILAEALPSPLVYTLLATQDSIWIGTDLGLLRYRIENGTSTEIPELAGSSVRSLAQDQQGRIWVGTLVSGIYLQEEPDKWRQFPPSVSGQWTSGGDFVPNGPVMALAAAPDGTVWAGVNDYGIVRWDGARWLEANSTAIVPNKTINALYIDPIDGTLWIGSDGGITRYDGRTATTINVAEVLETIPAYAITRSARGYYWFGTQHGLSYFRPDHMPPWLLIDEVQGEYTRTPEGIFQTQTDQRLSVQISAGDLHTPLENLVLLYRMQGPGLQGTWSPINAGLQLLPAFLEPGTYTAEFIARDLAFNYSDVQNLVFRVVTPPPTVTVPILGVTLERRVALAMGALLLVALASFLYVSQEIVRSTRRAREAIRRGFNPFVSGEPVRRADMFFGREELLQRIVDSLHENSIMIYGERRIGKTSLLYQLRDRLRELDDPEYWFVPVYIDLEGIPEEEFFHFLMDELLLELYTLPGANEEIRPHLQDLLVHTKRAKAYTYRDFMRDLRKVVEILEAYAQKHHPGKKLRIILLLDEMDVISEYSRTTQQQLRRIFMQNQPIGAVVAGIRISREWDRVESPWFNLFVEFELLPFTREEAIALLTEPVEGYYSWDPAALEFVIEKSEGRPFRLQQYALEAVNHMLEEGRRTITLEDVEAAHERIISAEYDHDIGIQEAIERQDRQRQSDSTKSTDAIEEKGEPHA